MGKRRKDLQEMTRREFLYLSGAGAAGMTLMGIPGLSPAAEKKPKYGGRLRVGERYVPTGLDAHRNQQFIDFLNYTLMYNALALMGPAPDYKVFPDVAKSWEISSDGREYVFPLREGVKFHHGKELDSGDVKYSMERVMNPATRSPRAFAFSWVDSIQTPDKYQVRIRLKEPFGPFLTSLTIMTCPIIPAGWNPTPTKPAPGTGPFAFKNMVLNESVEYTRNEHYWKIDGKTGMRLPYLGGIYIKKIPDDQVRWTALRAGDLDYIQSPPRKAVLDEQKKPTPGIVVPPPVAIAGYWTLFNVTKAPFNNKKVRQAVAHAVDKEELVRAAYWNLGIATNQPFEPGSWLYIPVKEREFNLDKARKLLAEAGYPNGFKAEFLTQSATHMVDGATIVAGQLKKIGIEMTIKIADLAAVRKMWRDGEFAISFSSDSQRLDPDDAYYLWLHSSQIGTNNYSRYANKEFDRLLEEGRTKWKWEDRLPFYRKALEIIEEDVPMHYEVKPKLPVAWRDSLKGHTAAATSWLVYHGGGIEYAWLDK